MPVDRIALYEKLEKMGLSMKSVYRENHATVAVEEFVASEGREYLVTASDQYFASSDEFEETVQHKCPQCQHEWETEETFEGGGVDIYGDEIADMVEVVPVASRGPALSPGSLVLTVEEVAYMVLDFARTQGGERA